MKYAIYFSDPFGSKDQKGVFTVFVQQCSCSPIVSECYIYSKSSINPGISAVDLDISAIDDLKLEWK